MTNSEIVLVTISGNNKLGVTAKLTEILAKYNAFILDIDQADIHRNLSLEILFRVNKTDRDSILNDLQLKAYKLDVNIQFIPINKEQYDNWMTRESKNKYIITLLGRVLTARQIAAVTSIVYKQGLNIDNIVRLTDTTPLDETNKWCRYASIELSVSGVPANKTEMKQEFLNLSSKFDFDISFQQENIFRKMRRVVCFDMDSTLIQTEVIDELAVRAGIGDKVKKITELAMQGKIDFVESFEQRVKLLKGLDVSVMEEIAENLPITEGLDRLIDILKKFGFKIAILSGGFTYFGNYLKDKYQFDYMYANELEIKDGKLTGNYVGSIIDAKRKAVLLKQIAQNEKVDIRQTVAVGDGANDLLMLDAAGLGIAFNAKPKVVEAAELSLSRVGIDGILYFLGYKDSML